MEAGEVPQDPVDEESFFGTIRKLGLGFARTMGLHGPDGEDRVHEGIVVGLDDLRDNPVLRASTKKASLFLCAIMKNQHLMELRHEFVVRANEGEIGREFDDSGSREWDPAFAMEMRRLRGLLFTALNRLNPDYELLLVMRYLEGATIDEIAAVTGKKPERIHNDIGRAKKQMSKTKELRAILDEWEFD